MGKGLGPVEYGSGPKVKGLRPVNRYRLEVS